MISLDVHLIGDLLMLDFILSFYANDSATRGFPMVFEMTAKAMYEEALLDTAKDDGLLAYSGRDKSFVYYTLTSKGLTHIEREVNECLFRGEH